jgi:CubicO group peptidase (beta-lactamase class C family)
LEPLVAVIEERLEDGAIIGAQLIVGNRSGIALEENMGFTTPDTSHRVDSDTQFCIASCSKPIAAACFLAIADAGQLDLDTPVNKWLPEFSGLRTTDGGRVKRAPTLRELLAHRGGVFSQRQRMTQEQYRAIRDYSQTLPQSVATIAHQPLTEEPGETFAYSGAGYLVAGRVAEVATGQPFETLLQQTICHPLEMEQTTFFPDPQEFSIAVGGARNGGGTMDGGAPHLAARPLRLAMVSGGLYATARDLDRFCRMVLDGGRVGDRVLLSEQAWKRYTSRAFEDQAYGLGWHVRRNSNRVTRNLSHTGALSAYRSLILIDLESEASVVALWTLAEAGTSEEDDGLAQELKRTWLETR